MRRAGSAQVPRHLPQSDTVSDMNAEQFEELVERAMESLPPAIDQGLDNVAIIIQDWPTREQMEDNDIQDRRGLLGLYEGVPLVDRAGYGMVAPDKITIFQKSIEALRLSRRDTVEEIRRTVLHEVAHHLGFSDEELHELGYG